MVAELRLHISLFANEQGHHRVTVVLVEVQCLGHHSQEPAVEVFGPQLVVGGQAACKVLDVVVLLVPFSTTRQEFVDGVVVLDVSRLYIGADVVHPTLSALLHLFHHQTLQVSVGEWLPRTEAQVVGTELRNTFHYVVSELIAARQEVLDAAHDAFLFVHLRDGRSFVRLFISITERLANQVNTQRLEACVPGCPDDAALFRETGFVAIVGQRLQALLHILRTVVEGFCETGLVFQFDAFALFVAGIPHDGAVVVGLGAFVGLQRVFPLTDHGQHLSLGIVIE